MHLILIRQILFCYTMQAGLTALHYAVINDHVQTVKILIESGNANWKVKDRVSLCSLA